MPCVVGECQTDAGDVNRAGSAWIGYAAVGGFAY